MSKHFSKAHESALRRMIEQRFAGLALPNAASLAGTWSLPTWKPEAAALKARMAPSLVKALTMVTAPLIYALAIPRALLDLMVTLYQKICFPLYGIAPVDRSAHVVIDRHALPSLDMVEKLNCLYCGYGNGVLAYAREIAARTEEHWCPIKHKKRIKAPHGRYAAFADYDDPDAARRLLRRGRQAGRRSP